MQFRIIEVITDDQFGKMIPSLWEAFKNPRNPGMELAFPVRGNGPNATAEAIEDCKQRMTTTWKNSHTTSHCLQVLDSDNDDAVVGAAMWNIYDTENNPFLKSPPAGKPLVNVNWWPEGSVAQRFTLYGYGATHTSENETAKKTSSLRCIKDLGMCYTDTKHRRQGIARLLMGWGTSKADELGVECFLSSTDIAVSLYQQYNFLVIDRTDIDMKVLDPSEEWKEWKKRISSGWPTYNMWRPIGGRLEDGVRYPWDE